MKKASSSGLFPVSFVTFTCLLSLMSVFRSSVLSPFRCILDILFRRLDEDEKLKDHDLESMLEPLVMKEPLAGIWDGSSLISFWWKVRTSSEVQH